MNTQEEAEFCDFVAGRSPALLRTAYLLTGDRAHAEDLLQTALTKMYLSWHRIRDRGALDSYARRVLVTTATSRSRRRWWGETPVAAVPERQAADFAAHRDLHGTLWPLVLALPAGQRAVLVLRYYEELTETEVADVLGISTGTVKSQTSRALTALRTQLGDTAKAKGPAKDD